MTASPGRSGGAIPLDSLEAEVAALEARLRTGEDRIRQARDSGQNAEARRYERAWTDILQRYEELCDEIARRRAASVGDEVSRHDSRS